MPRGEYLGFYDLSSLAAAPSRAIAYLAWEESGERLAVGWRAAAPTGAAASSATACAPSSADACSPPCYAPTEREVTEVADHLIAYGYMLIHAQYTRMHTHHTRLHADHTRVTC